MKELFEVEVVKKLKPVPEPLNCFLVAGFWAIGNYWKIYPNQFLTKDTAEEFIEEMPRGWICQRILSVELK